MYKNIRLTENRPIAAQDIMHIGPITVVCGKNNSGKTTLLHALSSGSHFINKAEYFVHQFAACIVAPSSSYFELAKNIVLSVLESADEWLIQNETQFAGTMRAHIMADMTIPESQYLFNIDSTLEKIQNIYKNDLTLPEVILIPPKRSLEDKGPINAQRTFGADGRGLLNTMFLMSTQLAGTSERTQFEEIKNLFTEISGGCELGIAPGPKNELELSFRNSLGDWIPAKSSGLGLQDLVVLIFYIVTPQYKQLFIEEPESHLHPTMQRKLLDVCKRRKDKRFFFSTHSSVFLDPTFVDTILHTEIKNGVIEVSNDTSRAIVLDSLGYSVTDNLVSDLIVLVEGPSDKPIIEEFLRQMGIYAKYSVKIWPLGGDNMDKVDLSVFAQSYKIIALIDQDPGSEKSRNTFMENCEALNIEVHQLTRTAIENYFTVSALRTAFGSRVSSAFTEIAPDKTLLKQLKEAGMDFSDKMKQQNQRVAQAMTLDDIKNTDLYKFLQRVEAKLEE